MAIVSNVRNDGNPAVTTGPKRVNSYNVKPTTVVAVATTGYDLGVVDVANFDFFNVAQTSAGTDLVILNSALPVGTEVHLFCISAARVKAPASSGIGVNGGNDTQGITLAAGSTYRFLRVSATNWICSAFSSAGAISNPIAA